MNDGSRTGPPHDAITTSLRPRVLIVATSSRPRGAEIEASQLGARLVASGYDCRHVALWSGTGASDPSIEVIGGSPLGLRTLRALRRAARGVDVVVAYGSSTLPACAISLFGSGTPFVYRSIGDPAQWITGWVHQSRTGLLFRRASHVVALWDGAAKDIAELYNVAPSRLSVIPNARDPERFRPPTPQQRADARHRLGVSGDALIVVALGALEPEKQLDLAVHTIAGLPDVTLLLAGDGSQRSSLAALGERLAPGRVRLLGHVDDPTIVLDAADALLLTSTTEGMPGAVLEAGLSGLPVVSTNVGMVEQMVVDGVTGMVVDSPTIEDLTSGVRTALDRRADFGPAARAHLAASYTWTTALPDWISLLVRVASMSKAR